MVELTDKQKAELQAMDDAANEAEEELNDIPDEIVVPVAKWMEKWFLKAGYKRLGRILVGIAKEHKEE